MVDNVLEKAGFVKNKTYKETKFLKPPNTTYAVYLDEYTRYGADTKNLIEHHTYTIEMYSYTVDKESEKRIEHSLDYYGISYDRNERYWIEEEQLFQTVYIFEYYVK